MLYNYLKIALRNLQKDKIHAGINVAGLAVGLACCLLIMLFVRNEWSYDRFHERADDLYRAWVLEDYGEDQQFFNTVTPIILAPTLAETFPEVEATVRIGTNADQVRRGETTLTETRLLADPNFFEVFDFPLQRGDPASVFANPNSVVLTPEAATRYFGQDDPLGQTLSMRLGADFQEYVVTGIAEPPPLNSSIQFTMAIPFPTGDALFSQNARQSWFNVFVETYVLLRDDVAAATLEAKLPAMVRQVLGDRMPENSSYTIGLQPMPAIHLDTSFPVGIAPVSEPAYSYILAGIALLVLLIACINFMTLSIGRSASRALEVGVRKAIGASRQNLMYQFWGEALLTTVLALVLGVALAEAFRPLFNTLARVELTLAADAETLLFLGGLMLLIGLVAGSYPAAVLSGFRPVEVLKGKLHLRGDTSLLRRSLVVVQFTLSIFLIASTLLMARQLDFLRSKNLGFDKEQVVVLQTSNAGGQGLRQLVEAGRRTAELLRNELAANPAVVNIATATFAFGQGWGNVGYDADDGTYRAFRINIIDEAYVPTLGMDLVAGRTFSRENPADSERGLLVNEAFVAEYGWADAVGQRLPADAFEDHEIIGVVKDFNYASLHGPVEPLAMAVNPAVIFRGVSNVGFPVSPTPKIAVRIEPDDVPGTLAALEAAWKRVAPDQPYTYAFLDQAVDAQYRQEERLGQMVGIASVLAIVIACLGLFGLAALAVARRTKEIGVRKVLGASAPSVALLLSKDFALLVLVAFVLAVPAAYLVMVRWLQDFAYRISPDVLTFALAGVLALAVALLTVSYQAVKAALTNPVESLRYE